VPCLPTASRTLTFAGMDTTSSALTRIFYLLAEHQDVQDKLRREIRQARLQKGDEGDFGYDDLEGLVYLDAVCRETLRLFVGRFILMCMTFLRCL